MKPLNTSRPDATAWLAAHGWSPFPFQREVWDAMARGESGLLHATTGAGKTYAVWLGLLDRLLQQLASGAVGNPAARVLLIFGNPAAMRAGERYLDDDLNRLFGG